MLIAVKECRNSYKEWLNHHISTSIHYGKVLNGAGNIYKDSIVVWSNCSKCNGRIFLLSKKDVLSVWEDNSMFNHKHHDLTHGYGPSGLSDYIMNGI